MKAIAKQSTELEPSLEVGQVLEGRYRVDYLLGQGGMAAVWAGTNVRTGKRVALKVLLPSLAVRPDIDALFLREGLAASRVNHPNVVTVFDVIGHDGTACIVMELLDGEPLGSYLARTGPLHPSDACSLLLPAMRGVAAAHAQGVVHRDIKPQNIFVCIDPDGHTSTTKVLDFGISAIVGLTREPAAVQAANLPMGTPAYMAPEHLSGASPVDARADVYGFGVLFFEALTGQVPFPGEPGAELYERIMTSPVPPLGQFRPDVPAGLVRIIETALAKEPAQRHDCVHRMIDAIEEEMAPARSPASGSPTRPALALVPGGGAEVRVPEAAPPQEKSGDQQATMFIAGFSLADEAGPQREPTREARKELAQSDRLGDQATVAPVAQPAAPRTARILRARRGWLWAAGVALLLAATGAALHGLAKNAEVAPGAQATPTVQAELSPAAPGWVSIAPLPPTAVAEDRGEPAPQPAADLAAAVRPAVAGLDPDDTRNVAPTRVRTHRRSPSATGRRRVEPGNGRRATRTPAVKQDAVVAGPRAGALSVEDF